MKRSTIAGCSVSLFTLLLLGPTCDIPAHATPERCYSVQAATFQRLAPARTALARLTRQLGAEAGELRLERIGELYVIRAGCREHARELVDLRRRIRSAFPDARIWPVLRRTEREIAIAAHPPEEPIPMPVRPAGPVEAADRPSAESPPTPARPADPVQAVAAAAAPPQMASAASSETSPDPVQGPHQPPSHAAAAATAPSPPPAGQPWLGRPLTLIAGLLLALTSVLVLGFGLFHRRDDDQEQPATPPPMPSGGSGLPTLLPAELEWLARNRRELAMIQANCLTVDRKARTFYLASAFTGEGRSTAAVALAWGLAVDAGNRVLLVDGSSDRPRLHQLFATDLGPGLTDALCEEATPEAILRPTSHKNLTLVTYGTSSAGTGSCAVDPLRTERFAALLARWRDEFDYVVCDGHPVLNSPNAATIASAFDGVVLVVRCERTKWEVAEEACQRLTQLGGHPLAVILNHRRYYIPRFLYRLV